MLSILVRSSPGGADTSTVEHSTAVEMKLETIPITCFPSKGGTSSRGAARAVAVTCTLPSAWSLTCSVEAAYVIQCPNVTHAEDSTGQHTGSEEDTAAVRGSFL